MNTPVPAEWSPHRAMWVGWPSHAELWEDNLEPAQAEVEALVRALAGPGRERVKLLVGKDEALADARTRFAGVDGVEVIDGRFGDIWLRDTGPIFGEGSARAAAFRFNGWGGKYELEHDDTVATQIGKASGTPLDRHDFILEGGALDHDGRGTILTTRQCLLNPNRNPDWTEAAAETALTASLGARKVLWLGDGLLNDHTDGHVDNLARFVAPGVVACPIAWGRNDPNDDVYDAVARALSQMTDATGASLKLLRLPSPGFVDDGDGRPAPASHMNFLIANGAVIVPTYGDARAADLACQGLKTVLPDREIITLPSIAILSGGGSFHCISQQEPA
ncbi:MAG: agmatine deiminase family protein [Brevundimonas sp.]|uniref:agmatine deiminase family protein n=1 Tax=Brevundimonas sp. TaxID=1871086 RepID=UPI00260E816A|nr:agmatine deiminase family protein [Brevundimonas sp.]MDI6624459.1 agmatine deiminase family protein [Brevundimonas sp.]MDQ7813228.1 agmatine deiminase family protein [Brevundimonas sp.]